MDGAEDEIPNVRPLSYDIVVNLPAKTPISISVSIPLALGGGADPSRRFLHRDGKEFYP